MNRTAKITVVLSITVAMLAAACGSDGGPKPVGPSGIVGPETSIAFIGRGPDRVSPDLYIIDADSGAVQQLTDTEEFEWWPVWSPDRQRLAFITWPAPPAGEAGSPTPEDIRQRHIMVGNADGSNQYSIADAIPLQSYSGGLSWSPDGSKIVHMAVVDPAEQPLRSKLRVVNVADGSEVPLPEERLGFLPAWSPDGTKIVFGAFVGELDERGKGESELFLMDSDGGNLRQITSRPGTDVDPTWSPDGTRIAWWGFEPQDDPAQTATPLLFMMDVASGEITQLGEGSGQAWSPDGQRIAFVLEEKPPAGVIRTPPDTNIYVVDVGTGERTQLTQETFPDLWPTWSPDGARIAYINQGDNPSGEIYIMNADGSDAHRLTQNDLTEAMLAWGPR